MSVVCSLSLFVLAFFLASSPSSRAEEPELAPKVEKPSAPKTARISSPSHPREHPLVQMLTREYGINQQFKKALDANQEDLNQIYHSNGLGLLHLAAQRAYENETLLLIKAGADVNLRDGAGKTPLHYAVADSRDDLATVRDILILSGAQIGLRDSAGDTPLMTAISRRGDARAVEFLLWLGESAEPAGVPPDRQPLALAVQRGDPEIIALVEAAKAAPHRGMRFEKKLPKFIEKTFVESQRQDLYRLQERLADGKSLDEFYENDKTPLIQAVYSQKPDLVTFLILCGADLNLPDLDGFPPMAWTFGWFGSGIEYCRLRLLAAGVETNVTMENGYSLLSRAAYRENGHAIQWLIWSGVDPNAASPVGTPMAVASTQGNAGTLELLRANGVTEDPYAGKPPEWRLKMAVKGGNRTELEKLWAEGVSVDLPLEGGSNGVIVAIQSGKPDMARYLLKLGSDHNYQNPKTGDTPLHATAARGANGHEAIREELLVAGANPNLPNWIGITPFMAACTGGDFNSKVGQMVLHGASLELRDQQGLSALDYAVQGGNQDLIAYLKSLGTEERRLMLQNAPAKLLGRWEGQTDDYKGEFFPGGRARHTWRGGAFVSEGGWSVEGDLLVDTPDPGSGRPVTRYLLLEFGDSYYKSLSMQGHGVETDTRPK